MIDLDRLKSTLLTSGLQTTNNALYQVINLMLDAVREFQKTTSASIASGSGVVSGIENADLLTHGDESATLPNSRQLIAGTNITFDDTVVNQRTVNASGGGETHLDGYWSPLTDGDLIEAELIFANGDAIMGWVPTP